MIDPKAGIAAYRETEINGADLDRELERQSSSFLHVAEHYVAAENAHDKQKLAVDKMASEIDERIRRDALEKKEKITEALIAKKINLDPDYQAAQDLLITLKGRKGAMQALKETWRGRQELLLERSRKQRDEIKGLNATVVKDTPLHAVGQ